MPEFDGRYELEWRYGVTISSRTLTHRHSFDVKLAEDPSPGTDFGAIGAQPRVGEPVDLDVWCQSYWDEASPLLGVGTSLEEIILWKYDDEPSLSKIYISSIATIPTSSYVGVPTAAMGAIFTFRIAGYRYPMRMYFMEGNNVSEERFPYSAFGAENKAYADFVTAGTSIIQGRSDAYPIATIALNLGQNEKLRDLRYRTP